MNTHRTSTGRIVALFVAVLALLALASCSKSDDKDSGSTTTQASGGSGDTGGSGSGSGGESATTIRFDKTIQQELADVGCYSGSVDGIVGPETDAAIVAFQTADGLTPDGELGPDTESALSKAADAGTKVCDGSKPSGSTTTTTPSGGGGAPCTATAVAAALPSGSDVTNYVCAEGYAAGSLSGGETFILQADGSTWTDIGTEDCGTASAGLPAVILEDGCKG